MQDPANSTHLWDGDSRTRHLLILRDTENKTINYCQVRMVTSTEIRAAWRSPPERAWIKEVHLTDYRLLPIHTKTSRIILTEKNAFYFRSDFVEDMTRFFQRTDISGNILIPLENFPPDWNFTLTRDDCNYYHENEEIYFRWSYYTCITHLKFQYLTCHL